MENGFLDEVVWPQKPQEEQHVVQFKGSCQIQNGEIETRQEGTPFGTGKAVQEPGGKGPLCRECQSFESLRDSWLQLLWEKIIDQYQIYTHEMSLCQEKQTIELQDFNSASLRSRKLKCLRCPLQPLKRAQKDTFSGTLFFTTQNVKEAG